MPIRFIKITSARDVSEYLTGTIRPRIEEGQKVLWLVPGGSGIDIAVDTARQLQKSPDKARLAVTLTDERYGLPGHQASNWQQLMGKGFSLPGAELIPILDGGSLADIADSYTKILRRELDRSDYSIALGGLGADGHIFGIKPASPAVDSQDYACGYEWDDYQRLTAAPELISRLDEVVIYAAGREKHQQLDNLQNDIPARQQPAQLLKNLNKVTIFNDYKGEQI